MVVREVAASHADRPCVACPWYVAKRVLLSFSCPFVFLFASIHGDFDPFGARRWQRERVRAHVVLTSGGDAALLELMRQVQMRSAASPFAYHRKTGASRQVC